jgi:hypothetical protein
MGGGSGEAVELRQVLFALEDELGRRERIGKQSRLLRHAVGIEGGKGGGRHDGEPEPAVRIGGTTSSVPGNQGSGKGVKASAVMPMTESRPSGRLKRIGCSEDEMMTGTQTSGAKGLASPPVMKSSAVSWQRSKASSRKAEAGVSRCAGRKRTARKKLTAASSAISTAAGSSGSGNSSHSPTTMTVIALAGDRQPAQADERVEPEPVALLEVGGAHQ